MWSVNFWCTSGSVFSTCVVDCFIVYWWWFSTTDASEYLECQLISISQCDIMNWKIQCGLEFSTSFCTRCCDNQNLSSFSRYWESWYLSITVVLALREETFFTVNSFVNCRFPSTDPSGPGPPHYRDFTITLRHTTLGSTPLDEWSVQRRDTFLTTHSTHKGQISILPAGFERTTPASDRPHNHAGDCNRRLC